MHVYEVLVPLTFNDGKPIPESVHEHLRLHAVKLCGGFTHNPTTLHGAWQADDGTLYMDSLTTYILFADDDTKVLTFAKEVARVCDQYAVSVITPQREAILVSA